MGANVGWAVGLNLFCLELPTKYRTRKQHLSENSLLHLGWSEEHIHSMLPSRQLPDSLIFLSWDGGRACSLWASGMRTRIYCSSQPALVFLLPGSLRTVLL